MYNFKGKTVLVVGASKGIGLDTAIKFAENGGSVYFASRSGSEEVVNELRGRGFEAHNLVMDARSEQEVDVAIKKIIDREAKIDVLVNVLAINQCAKIEEIELERWNDVINTNITSIFLTCRACLPHMKRRKYGKIINVSSVAARNRSPVSGVHYVASKSAILGFTRQLSFEVGPHGINVNATCPGQTLTPMLRSSMNDSEQAALAQSIPLRRIANAEDQANAIMYLASDEASYLAGAVIDVNGGQI